MNVMLSSYRQPHVDPLRSVLSTAATGSYTTALDTLYDYAAKHPDMGNCHEVAHGVGLAATRTDHSDYELLQSATSECDAAFSP